DGEGCFQLVEPLLGRVVRLEPRRPLQLDDERAKRAVGVVGRALVTQSRVRVTGDALGESRRKAGFADPRLARDQHNLPIALPGEALPFQQEIELVLAADEIGQTCLADRLKTASDTLSTAHAATSSAIPLTSCRPRSRRRNRSPSSLRVEAATTIVPGSAKSWRRAARFGVSPTTAPSRNASSRLRSPTTTKPLAMPMRTASGSPARVSSWATVAMISSPARTVRSASSSCARG